MQIRELDLKELDTIYELLFQLYPNLTYKEFEDLVYDMRDINYKMIGIIDNEKLITFAGIAILTTFKDKRHIKVFDLITDKKYDIKKYDKIMKDYLIDYANMGMCKTIVYN